jgi:nicotinamidase-related amidase
MPQNKQNTALLMMDFQAQMLSSLEGAEPIINNAAKALAYARKNNIPVMYVRVCFRPGGPEISAKNKGFSVFGKDMLTPEFAEAWKQIHSSVAPLDNEPIIDKRRVSAFSGSDLEVLLRAHGIEHMVLTGFATSGVVLSTLREAADKDYQITVLHDCCGDRDEEVHRVLTTKVFPRQAEVLSVDEWAK